MQCLQKALQGCEVKAVVSSLCNWDVQKYCDIPELQNGDENFKK